MINFLRVKMLYYRYLKGKYISNGKLSKLLFLFKKNTGFQLFKGMDCSCLEFQDLAKENIEPLF